MMLQAEADQRNGTGDQTGDDGNETFGAVVFEALALANERLADRCGGGRHFSIIRRPVEKSPGVFRHAIVQAKPIGRRLSMFCLFLLIRLISEWKASSNSKVPVT